MDKLVLLLSTINTFVVTAPPVGLEILILFTKAVVGKIGGTAPSSPSGTV